MNPEDSLDQALRRLSDATRQEAPPYLEGVLVKAFRAGRKRPAPRPWFWAAAAVAAAAVLVVAALMVSRPRQVPPVRRESVAAVVAKTVPPAMPVRTELPRKKKPKAAPRKPVETPVSEEVMTSFIPLRVGDEGEGGQVVRVTLPRSALVTFGLPMNPERSGFEPVKADVVFGQDGVARAIRFVK